MGISPFKCGDYVQVRPDFYSKERFDINASPLRPGEIGIVTAVSASGDRRPRYIQVNGKPPLYHFSMFEEARPTLARKVYLKFRHFTR
jgi:hypothetical protein